MEATGKAYVVEILDDDLDQRLKAGDHLTVDPAATLEDGKLVCHNIRGTRVIGRYRKRGLGCIIEPYGYFVPLKDKKNVHRVVRVARDE